MRAAGDEKSKLLDRVESLAGVVIGDRGAGRIDIDDGALGGAEAAVATPAQRRARD